MSEVDKEENELLPNQFQPGNMLWKARSRHGRKKAYESAEELLEACEDYFVWVEKHPIVTYKPMVVDKQVYQEPTYIMRAMTIDALTVFLGISRDTWIRYREDDDFCEICTYVDQTIRSQKFEGAAAGVLKENLIARELGIKDGVDADITSGGKPVKNEWHVHPVTTKADKKD